MCPGQKPGTDVNRDIGKENLMVQPECRRGVAVDKTKQTECPSETVQIESKTLYSMYQCQREDGWVYNCSL